MHDVVVGKWRIELCCLPRIGANRLNPDSQHIALFGQQRGGFFSESWRVGSIVFQVDVIRSLLTGPAATQQYPGFSWNAAMLCLPFQDIVRGYEVIGTARRYVRNVEHTSRSDELARRNPIHAV